MPGDHLEGLADAGARILKSDANLTGRLSRHFPPTSLRPSDLADLAAHTNHATC